MRLAWAKADKTHRSTLSQFVCTDPAKRAYDPYRGRFHPREWELEVQSMLRGVKIPLPRGEQLDLGYDKDGLAVAVHYAFVPGSDNFRIHAVACSLHAQGKGYGSQAIERAFATFRNTMREESLKSSGVITLVHEKNERSRALMQKYGFEVLMTQGAYVSMACELYI